MQNKVKYPPLTGVCRTCAGCNRLEDINFKGKDKCEHHLRLISPIVQESINKIHKDLGMTGEQLGFLGKENK